MIVTVLTDFGTSDSYVAEMKGAMLSLAPAVTLVDVTHELAPGDVASARYLIGRAWSRFPAGTVHLAVVDPGVGTARRALAAASHGHWFVAPDNGLLTPVLDQDAAVVALPVPADASPTFHGRDVFAPAAARLALGHPLASLGTPITDFRRTPDAASPAAGAGGPGVIVHIDRFGTLVTNLPGHALARASRVELPGGFRAAIGRTFGDVGKGQLVAYVGSAGTVEVAVRDESAARMTGASIGAEVRVVGEGSKRGARA